LVTLVIGICFGIFAFTCLLAFLSFSEICAKQISGSKNFIAAIRLMNLAVLAFGMVTNIAGFDLSALWNLSDFANIVMVCCNLPLLYLGFSQVKRPLRISKTKMKNSIPKHLVRPYRFGMNVPLHQLST
jgi:AGCS family alanine or glycine:cation symporter